MAKTLIDPVIIGRSGKMVVVAERAIYDAAVKAKRSLPDDALVQYWSSGVERWSAPMKLGIMARFVMFEPAQGELKNEGLSYP